jgi:rhodanese-related sulfurtransferase
MRTLLVMILILFPPLVLAGQESTICHNELSAWIKSGKHLAIVDIQNAASFQEHHYDSSLESGNEPARLKKISRRLRSTGEKVIVVSSAGGADARRAADKLAAGGVARSRLLVLEGGMEAAARSAACDCCKPAALTGETK